MIFSHIRRLGPFSVLKLLNFNIVFEGRAGDGFRKAEFYFGVRWGSILGAISIHFMAFS